MALQKLWCGPQLSTLFHTPYHLLLPIDILKFLSFYFDLIADIEIFFSIDAIGSDDEIFVKQTFYALDGDEHTIVVTQLNISFIGLS